MHQLTVVLDELLDVPGEAGTASESSPRASGGGAWSPSGAVTYAPTDEALRAPPESGEARRRLLAVIRG
jgi:hypothetical protein